GWLAWASSTQPAAALIGLHATPLYLPSRGEIETVSSLKGRGLEIHLLLLIFLLKLIYENI
ncbi:hypothetical protein, partial [Fluviicola chungangensis]|uniref:hypothetical protein n=1 Tax=Fluviicola chungangensis TaxID=2597671 RepID=UPI001C920BAA